MATLEKIRNKSVMLNFLNLIFTFISIKARNFQVSFTLKKEKLKFSGKMLIIFPTLKCVKPTAIFYPISYPANMSSADTFMIKTST